MNCTHLKQSKGLPQALARAGAPGFTLVELLVVIAIIAILASIAMTVLPGVADKRQRSQVQVQLRQIETAIERYHGKHSVFPPDNPNDPNINQLYYELIGAVWDKNTSTYSDTMGNPINLSPFGVGGIVNSVKADSGERPVNFLGQDAKTVDIGGAKMIKVPVDWPDGHPNPPVPAKPTINVWRYNSSKPVHKKNSYDLWAVIVLRGKEVTISNWERY